VSKIGEKGRKEMWAEEKKRKWRAAVCGYREQRREKEEKRRKREGVRWEEAGREEK
jgi:Zn ribbon nucleic-acid-binding protein